MSATESIITRLIEFGCLKTGEFKLKSGIVSPYYVNLREISMNTELFHDIVTLMKKFLEINIANQSPELTVIGVPYGVVPLASVVAYTSNLAYYPMRKEDKGYGVKPDFNSYKDRQFILIEDIMTSGSSILETINKLEGLTVTDVFVVVDRESGGKENLMAAYPHLRVHSLIKISEIKEVLQRSGNNLAT